MSLSEFDKQLNGDGDEIFSNSLKEQVIPSDFGEEDLVFAQELNSIFSAEKEELPPYFVQTLLASEGPLYQPVEPGFEHKTRARVFRHLKLRRRLFYTPRSAFGALISGVSGIFARRSLLISIAAFMLIMLFTVAFTGPSFESGVAILLHGSHGGVYKVRNYPKVVHVLPSKNVDNRPVEITLSAAQQQLHFSISWPQNLPKNYSLDSIYLYQVTNQTWADGPIVELVYNLNGSIPKGTGQIVIREFKPSGDVLQLVQDNAAHPVQVDKNGEPKAIYVDGQWIPHGRFLPQWVNGGRSELIYQQNGVVFWIAGDQSDGIGQKALWNIAQSFQIFPFNRMALMKGETIDVTQACLNDARDPFTNDVLVIFPDDGPDGPYFISVSSYQAGKSAQKLITHNH